MGISPYSLEQRFEFIKDCYKSGLSIPAWCHDNNIAPGTFYGWIKQVTSHGYEIPDSLNYHPDVKRQRCKEHPLYVYHCSARGRKGNAGSTSGRRHLYRSIR